MQVSLVSCIYTDQKQHNTNQQEWGALINSTVIAKSCLSVVSTHAEWCSYHVHGKPTEWQYQCPILQWFCCKLPTTGNRLWKNNAGCVDCLEDSPTVDAPRHLAYQDRRYALRTQFLVYTQEINFDHLLLTMNRHIRHVSLLKNESLMISEYLTCCRHRLFPSDICTQFHMTTDALPTTAIIQHPTSGHVTGIIRPSNHDLI